jgi:hypothetical protein
MTTDSAPTAPVAVALPVATQTRNLLLFAGCVGMRYLAAPVVYIGGTQAALLDQLGTSTWVANSPEVLYLAFAIAPLFVTSVFAHPRWLKPLLVTAYLCDAVGIGLVAAAIAGGFPSGVIGAAVILQAIVTGIFASTSAVLAWEAMGRGVAESRRGWTLALAYGIGPILAAAGAIGSQALITGETLGLRVMTAPSFPSNFALVFAAATLPMLVAATFASLFVLPEPDSTGDERDAKSREGLPAALAGFFGDPTLRRVAIAAVLIYASTTIVSNLTLYTGAAMGGQPSDRVMVQFALRFATKAVAGLLFGLLVARTNPLAGLLATGFCLLAAPLYAVTATGIAYLATFQIYGAGELFGVYTPNYILAASSRRHIRRNLACDRMLPAIAAPFGLLFGGIADMVGSTGGRAVGYRASFFTCAAIVGMGLVIALTLPRRPRPADDALGDEDGRSRPGHA